MEHIFILSLIIAALLLFATEKLRPDIVGMMVMMTLILTSTVTIEEGFSGFSNPAVITVIAMFILSSGLVRTGVADYIGKKMLQVSGKNPVMLTITVMLTVGILSAFMNNIGATAILITTIYAISRKTGYPAGKLLIPLSFGSLLGGITTMIGTPPNLLVSMALEEAGHEPFAMFDFLPTGIVILTASILYMAFIGRHLLPGKKEDTYTSAYSLEQYLTEISIPEGSSLIDKSIRDSAVQQEYGLTVLRIKRKTKDNTDRLITPTPDTVLQEGDRLVVEGNVEHLIEVKGGSDFDIHIEAKITDDNLTGPDLQIAEAAIAPNSPMIGRNIKQADIRRRFGVLAIALRRRGGTIVKDYMKEPFQAGDVLLLQGKEEALEKLGKDGNFLLIKVLEEQARSYKKAPLAIGSLAIAVMLASTGTLHISAAAFLGVLLMLFSGCINFDEIYKSVEWRVIFLIAGMMPLGIAMDQDHTGTAAWLANHLIGVAGDYGPLVVLASIFLITILFTEVMSNAAAAVLSAPIGIALAVGMGLEPHPFMMAIAIAASTTFLTPIGHQANVLVYSIGGYRFTDFTKVGVLLNIIVFTISMFLIPIVWPFTPLD